MQRLVFKFISIDPDIKCSEIVASIGVEKVTPELISTVVELITDTLLFYGFRVGFGTSDAAGCNWVAFNSMSELTIREISAQTLVSKYPHINFDLQIVYQDPITGHYVIFLPDMPHLTKNMVTALELSGSKIFTEANQVWQMSYVSLLN